MKNKNKKGFTLMELVVVIAILAILGLMLYPQVTKYLDSAKKTTAKANAQTAYTAALFISSTDSTKIGSDIKADVDAYLSAHDTTVKVDSAECSSAGTCTVEVTTSGVTVNIAADGTVTFK